MLKEIALAVVLMTGCATDDPAPPPTCAEIDAGNTLACNAHGLCTWEGQECCSYPRPGTAIDPKCEETLAAIPPGQ